MRWDNAPHHREIETFPFHIHTKSEILPSEEVRLDEILKYTMLYAIDFGGHTGRNKSMINLLVKGK